MVSGDRPHTARRPLVQKLAVVTLVATLVLVAVGGFTRGSGSGFGCSDRWPLCENGALGGLLPRFEFHMMIEWSHRWLAGIVGILALVTAAVAIGTRRREVRIVGPAVATVVAIGIQAFLGRMVVKGDLDADLVSVHFMVSMLVVGLLAVVSVTAGVPPGDKERVPSAPSERRWGRWMAGAATGSLLVALVGTLVHDRFLPGWPLVNVTAAADAGVSGATIAWHTTHRTLAGLELVALVGLWVAARRRARPRFEQNLLLLAMGCYVVGAALGAGHVIVGTRSSGLVFAHLAVAELAWAALVAATTHVVVRPDRYPSGTAVLAPAAPGGGTSAG